MLERKSFVLYGDMEGMLSELSDAAVGRVMRAVFRYFNSGETEKLSSAAERIVFGIIRAALERDGEKYDRQLRQNSENGRKGGAPKGNTNACKQKPEPPKPAPAPEVSVPEAENNSKRPETTEKQPKTTETPETSLSDNDNESDNVNESVSVSESGSESSAAADADAPAPPPKRTYGHYQNILLTAGEYFALCREFGEHETDDCIEKMSCYCRVKKKTYSDYEAALRHWLIKDNGSQTRINDEYRPADEPRPSSSGSQHSYDIESWLRAAYYGDSFGVKGTVIDVPSEEPSQYKKSHAGT